MAVSCVYALDTALTAYILLEMCYQIRVHLQYTGYPIANDVLYLSEVVCKRSTLGTGADRAATFVNSEDLDEADPNCDSNSTGVDAEGNEDFRYDPMCTNCPDLAPKG